MLIKVITVVATVACKLIISSALLNDLFIDLIIAYLRIYNQSINLLIRK